MAVAYSVESSVGIVVLDRPEVLNSFDETMGLETLRVVEGAAADDSVRCIVITGAGRAFCAGEDLGALSDQYSRGEVPDLGDTLVKRYNPLIRTIRSAPKPVVAAVNGVAAGAGASLALACDVRVASEHAKLVLAFIGAALVPDSGAVWFLSNMVGTARAWQLASTGRPVAADEALALGLFDQVVAQDAFEETWRSAAQKLAAGPTRAFALTKQLVNGAPERSLEEQLELEVDAQSAAGRTDDHLEGVQAFLAKRKPDFQGR
jgi:2-(1,2-epoxy-1,2-dihydrophenyl)acetyl-CoA isomerase